MYYVLYVLCIMSYIYVLCLIYIYVLYPPHHHNGFVATCRLWTYVYVKYIHVHNYTYIYIYIYIYINIYTQLFAICTYKITLIFPNRVRTNFFYLVTRTFV